MLTPTQAQELLDLIEAARIAYLEAIKAKVFFAAQPLLFDLKLKEYVLADAIFKRRLGELTYPKP